MFKLGCIVILNETDIHMQFCNRSHSLSQGRGRGYSWLLSQIISHIYSFLSFWTQTVDNVTDGGERRDCFLIHPFDMHYWRSDILKAPWRVAVRMCIGTANTDELTCNPKDSMAGVKPYAIILGLAKHGCSLNTLVNAHKHMHTNMT